MFRGELPLPMTEGKHLLIWSTTLAKNLSSGEGGREGEKEEGERERENTIEKLIQLKTVEWRMREFSPPVGLLPRR